MRQQIFRALGLAAIVLLSDLPLARASAGGCHVTCCSGGGSYNGPLPSGSTSCCQIFRDLCGGLGAAFQDPPPGEEVLVCLPYGTCGGIQD
jgi:hypothetical protein